MLVRVCVSRVRMMRGVTWRLPCVGVRRVHGAHTERRWGAPRAVRAKAGGALQGAEGRRVLHDCTAARDGRAERGGLRSGGRRKDGMHPLSLHQIDLTSLEIGQRSKETRADCRAISCTQVDTKGTVYTVRASGCMSVAVGVPAASARTFVIDKSKLLKLKEGNASNPLPKPRESVGTTDPGTLHWVGESAETRSPSMPSSGPRLRSCPTTLPPRRRQHLLPP